MKIKRAAGRLFSHNETIALWVSTNHQSKVLFWSGSAWKLPKEYEKLRIERVFGTIPQSILTADTINLLIHHREIVVDCSTCRNRKSTECTNTSECDIYVGKPHWDWNNKLGGIL